MPQPHVRIREIRSLAECRQFQYLLLGDLRDLLEDPQDESNRQWLLAVLEILIQLMPQERLLHEQDGGYLAKVLEEFPTRNRQVMSLHLRKLHLDYSLRELFRRVHEQESWTAHADQVSCELRDWMALFQKVQYQENRLVMDFRLLNI